MACLIAFFSIVEFSFANETQRENLSSAHSNIAIGLNIGKVVGNGLLIRGYFDKFFAQATYAGFVDEDQDEAYFSTSASLGKYISVVGPDAGNKTGIKFIAGGGAIYDRVKKDKQNEYNLGIGLGLDYGAVKHQGLVVSANLMYVFTLSGLRSPEFTTLEFKPTLGLLYNFD